MDYPDYTRLFNLIGQSITLNVTIEASDVTLPVSIDAATATVGINIEATDVTLPVSIAASDVTINVALGSMPFETTAENLLTNPGFEDGDLTGWAATGAGTTTVQSDEKWKGTYAVKIEPDASALIYLNPTESQPCYPGQRILASAAMKADANITESNLGVAFYTAEEIYLSVDYSADYGGDYAWAAKVHTAEAPAGAAFARPRCRFRSGDPAGVGYADSFIAARLVQPALDSSLNLAINIVAQDIESLDINIAASDITLNMNLAASDITLNVNLHAQTADIDFNFNDQAVAVFDAAKWFAHQADQVFVTGSATVTDNTAANVINYTVPGSTVLYVVGVGYSVITGANLPNSCHSEFVIVSTLAMVLGSRVGIGLSLDTPLRATAGQHVYLNLGQYGSGANLLMWGSFWGYLEAV